MGGATMSREAQAMPGAGGGWGRRADTGRVQAERGNVGHEEAGAAGRCQGS